MKKKITTILAVALSATIIFSAGILASNSEWLNFEGDVIQSENHVNEIMEILRQVNTDKLTAEEALAALEALNPAGLAKLNKELREENKALSEQISHLEAELTKANNEVDGLNEKTNAAVNEARELVK